MEAQNSAPSESQQLVQALALSVNLSASKEQNHADSVITAITEAIRRVNILDPNSEHTRVILRQFEALAYQSYTARKPQVTLLPSLYQFNFIRALFANVDVLGLSSDQMSDDAISPFNSVNPEQTVSLATRFSRLPIPLRPTPLQCTTEHHPWIDLLPHPQLRDNLFKRGFDSFDEDEFCHNLRGAIPGYEPGVLVWRAPWDPSGWEVTETFVKSWAWSLKGCWDLVKSTNEWRRRRGERPLLIDCNDPA